MTKTAAIQKVEGKPDSDPRPPSKSSKHRDYTIEALRWDLGAIRHNMSLLDPVLTLLCINANDLDKCQLKALIDCAMYTLERAIDDITADLDSVIKNVNVLFPEAAEEPDLKQ